MSLSASVPDEPSDGSVVLDATGRAWQRRAALWVSVRVVLFAVEGVSSSWPHLVVDRGPLTLLVPDAGSGEAKAASEAPVLSDDEALAQAVRRGDRSLGRR